MTAEGTIGLARTREIVGTRTIDDLLAAARARLDRLDPVAAHGEIEASALVVDTRCAEARASGVAL